VAAANRLLRRFATLRGQREKSAEGRVEKFMVFHLGILLPTSKMGRPAG
jgi:hypothetical protein